MDGFLVENPIKMDDLGVPLFSETSIYIYIYTYLETRRSALSTPPTFAPSESSPPKAMSSSVAGALGALTARWASCRVRGVWLVDQSWN